MIAMLSIFLKLDNLIIILLTTCINHFISFETCFVTCWMILILSNLTLRSVILCQIFSSGWDFGEVCARCAKSACSCCLVLKLLKFSLYLMLNKKFQYNDLEAPRCLSYPVVRPSVRSRDYLRKIVPNMVIL
jgi:membrane-associated HD superfamily phosphohydrolase